MMPCRVAAQLKIRMLEVDVCCGAVSGECGRTAVSSCPTIRTLAGSEAGQCDSGGGSGRAGMGVTALQDWCRLQLAGYPNLSLTDMSTSWRDGIIRYNIK